MSKMFYVVLHKTVLLMSSSSLAVNSCLLVAHQYINIMLQIFCKLSSALFLLIQNNTDLKRFWYKARCSVFCPSVFCANYTNRNHCRVNESRVIDWVDIRHVTR